MAEPLVVVGAGGFGRETLDLVEAINSAAPEPAWEVLGVVDDSPSDENLARLMARRIPYLGTTEALTERNVRPCYVLGIGSPGIRKLLAEMLDAAGFSPATLVHPEASIGSQCAVGEGTIILAGARLTTNVRLGRHTHVNPNVTIGHDSAVGDFVSMNPASSVSGDCVVEDGVLIGVGGVVMNGLTVGAGATVGGAACVVKNVSPGAVVVGVPAQPLKTSREERSLDVGDAR